MDTDTAADTVHAEGKDPGRLLPSILRELPQIVKCRPTLLAYKQPTGLHSVHRVEEPWSPWVQQCCYHGFIGTAGFTIFLNSRHPYRIRVICVETNIYQATPRSNKHFIYSVTPLSPRGYMFVSQIYKWKKIALGGWVPCEGCAARKRLTCISKPDMYNCRNTLCTEANSLYGEEPELLILHQHSYDNTLQRWCSPNLDGPRQASCCLST